MDLLKHKDAGFLLCLILVLGTALTPLQAVIDNTLFDRVTISRDSYDSPDPILIDIDDKSLEALGRWPWPRHLHAEMIDLLNQAGAQVIGYNIAFVDPDIEEPLNDLRLREAISKSANIVLPVFGESGTTVYPFRNPQIPNGSQLGHVEVDVDSDGRVRRTFLKAGIDEPNWPAFGLAMLDNTTVLNTFFPGTRAPHHRMGVNRKWSRDREVLIPRPPQAVSFQRFSFIDVLEKGIPSNIFNGRPVFVGIQAAGLEARFLLAGDPNLNMVSGTVLHANLYQALVQHAVLTPILPIWGLCYAIILTALLYATFILLEKSIVIRSLSAVLSVIFLALPPLAVYLGYWLPIGASLVGAIVVVGFIILKAMYAHNNKTRTDQITSLSSKRMFDETLSLEWEQAIRKKTPLSVILIEIDQFKRFSETFGPERANWVQARVGHILQNHQRRSRDLVARTGSAQFAVVLPITPNAIAYSLAEKMRSDVESLQIEHVKAHQVITISTSIITTSTSESPELQDWIKQGYQQLNTAMANNGNYSANCAPSSSSANASA